MQSPGRPRGFDEDEMLGRIMRLFWENGYEATGLSDIIAATGLGKASLYKAFGNKQAIYLKALGLYEAQAVAEAVALLSAPDQPAAARLKAFLTLPISAVAQADRRGCFLCNAATDRAALDEEIGGRVRQGFDRLRRAISACLSEAVPGPEIVGQCDMVLTLYSGLRVMARAGQPVEALQGARDQALRGLGLF